MELEIEREFGKEIFLLSKIDTSQADKTWQTAPKHLWKRTMIGIKIGQGVCLFGIILASLMCMYGAVEVVKFQNEDFIILFWYGIVALMINNISLTKKN